MDESSVKKRGTKDLTVGPPLKLMIGFMIPLFFGIIFQQLYNTVDTMIVGKFLGADALAGVGSTGAVSFLILGFCMGMTTGSGIPVAQKFGEKNFADVRKYVGNIIWVNGSFAVVVTIAISILCKPILKLMDTPENIFDYAYSYISIIFMGIPITMLYNSLSAIIRALGDSKRPVYFLVIASLTNVVLDIVFILLFKMGPSGAALATIISQGVSGTLCLTYIVKKLDILKLSRDDLKPDRKYIIQLLWMGMPMGLQFSITAIGSTILQAAVNSLGSDYVASIAAASKVQMLSIGPFDAIGTTMATFGAQNLGARKLKRIDQGVKTSVTMVTIYALFVLGILYLFGDLLLRLFINKSETFILEQSYRFLVINACFYIPLSFINIFRLLIQGLGYSRVAMFAGVFEMVARIIIATVLIPKLGFLGACFGNAAAWIMADSFLLPAYFCIRKRIHQRIGTEEVSVQ